MANEQKSLLLSAGIVQAKFPGVEDELSACATVLSIKPGIAISHGSLLLDLTAKDEAIADKIKSGSFIRKSCLQDSSFSLLLSDSLLKSSKDIQFSNTLDSTVTVNEDKCKDSASATFLSIKCEFIGGFRNFAFQETLSEIMPDDNWTFSDSDAVNSSYSTQSVEKAKSESLARENYLAFQLLSYFIVFKFDSSMFKHIPNLQIQNLPSISSNSLRIPIERCCQIGDTAEIVSTPFAGLSPSVFFNSYSVGVVSNVHGKNSCWILTDARCVPGSEGAPLYTCRNKSSPRYLTGIIASPMCWKNNEWVGFAVACSLDSIYQALAQLSKNASMIGGPNISIKEESVNRKKVSLPSTYCEGENLYLSSTVLVEVGNTWGSGVIVEKELGLIITCSHVVKDSGSCPVTISTCKGPTKYRASVVYRQSLLETPYDIAVLQCHQAMSHLSSDWSLQALQPCVGQNVFVAGHALFSIHLALQPSLTQGVVSNVIFGPDGKPVLIQSSCAVHPGTSGGPLFSETGQLIGIVVCNTKDSVKQTSFPHLNLCVPAINIWPLLQKYTKTQDATVFSSLQINDLWIRKLWALGNASAGEDHVRRSKL